jgi:hypothetical protein
MVPSIYMAIVCVDPRCRRGLDAYSSWGRSFLEEFPGSELQFFHRDNFALVPGRSVCVPGPWDYPYQAVLDQDFASARDFFRRGYFEWYIRTSYDVYCHLPTLRALIGSLERFANPRSDIVVKGEAFRHPPADDPTLIDWIHGGSGWLMSRAAVTAFLVQESEMRKDQELMGDDVIFGRSLAALGLLLADVFSGAFQGSPIPETIYEALEQNMNFDAVAVACSRSGESFHPRVRVRDRAFLHNGREVNWAVKLGRRILEEAGERLWLESSANMSWFCRT